MVMNSVYVVFQCDFQTASSDVVFVCGSESTAKQYCEGSLDCIYEEFDFYD